MKRGKRWKGREREGEEREDHVFLTFSDGHWASNLQSRSRVSLDDHLCSSRSNFVHHFASERYVFSSEKHIFSPNRTLLLAGS